MQSNLDNFHQARRYIRPSLMSQNILPSVRWDPDEVRQDVGNEVPREFQEEGGVLENTQERVQEMSK